MILRPCTSVMIYLPTPPPHPHPHSHNLHSFSKHHRGSGFIARLETDGQNTVWLLTCHHVLPSLTAAQASDIYFGRIIDDADDDNAGKYKGKIIRGKELFDGSFFKTDVEEVSLIRYMQYWLSMQKLIHFAAMSFIALSVLIRHFHRLRVGGKNWITLL